MKTYKILAALLGYPTDELAAAVPEMRTILDREALLHRSARAALEPLLQELETGDLYELQERYVALFDRVRSLSLHLFEHVHGESRDRGQAMVDLKALYARHGYTLIASELPDFIPAFLEFLSRIPEKEALGLLKETCHLFEGIAARLAARESPYAALFVALLGIAGHAHRAPAVSDAQIRAEDDPAALDAAWAEEPAFGAAPPCNANRRPNAPSVVRFRPRATADERST